MELAGTDSYSSWWLADILHSFPHLDLTLRWTNATFQPNSPQYRESLVFWAAIPVLWLLLTLLIFLIYFCYRCCQKDSEKKQRGACLQWAMAILALITCAAIGVGFYGNEATHNGMTQLATSTRDVDMSIDHMQHQVYKMGELVNFTLLSDLSGMQAIIKRQHNALNNTMQRNLKRMLNNAMKSTRQIFTTVSAINTRARSIDLTSTARDMKQWEFYRWITLIAFLCWELVLCLLLLLGIGRTSKCTLLLFCALGIFTLVLCWAATGVHLGSSVALGDFCVAPDSYVERKASAELDREIVQYYLRCDDQVRNPFGGSLKSAFDSINAANNTLTYVSDIALTVIPQPELSRASHDICAGYDKSVHILHQLTALVQCTNINKDYKTAINAVCYTVLPGVCFMLMSAVLVAFLFTILVLLASCAWRHFGRRKGYCEVDEDDPFIPRGTSLSGATSSDNTSPSYYSFTRNRQQQRDPTASVHRKSSPPPAGGASYNGWQVGVPTITQLESPPRSHGNHGGTLPHPGHNHGNNHVHNHAVHSQTLGHSHTTNYNPHDFYHHYQPHGARPSMDSAESNA